MVRLRFFVTAPCWADDEKSARRIDISARQTAEEVDSISLRLDAVYRRMSASRKDADATIRKFRRFEEANEVWVGREL
jgi:hypothetical protein